MTLRKVEVYHRRAEQPSQRPATKQNADAEPESLPGAQAERQAVVDELLALKESFFGRKCPEPELRRILYLERRSGFLRRWIAAKVDGAITKRPSWRHQLLLARCYVRLARIESRGGEDDELFEAIEQHVPQWMLEAVAEGRFSEEDLAPLVTGVTTEKLTP